MLWDFSLQSIEPFKLFLIVMEKWALHWPSNQHLKVYKISHSGGLKLFERVFFLFLRSTCLKINLENSLVNDVLVSVITGCPKVTPGLKAPPTWGF